ncbi:hypothetical protein BCR39DRAFT_529618 [Naematelia encephala]|uniref:Uncharacterized protein n=1 Tax=Naematelia encephala TaxID=71784 RepID=A0A1Y2B6B9_9TREE|nr:hypothetical protein BCR39DRAFT_529618 [Naematelia encephala]
MTTLLWSSPIMLGRSSSPLNPNARSDRSSSPLTSPTPFASSSRGRAFPALTQGLHDGSPTLKHRHSQPYEYRHRPIPTRYTRPTAAKRHSLPAGDLFTEGTTPTEGAMWREKFSRRIEERERRKRAREDDLERRRSSGGRDDELMSEEEADRRAQEDDEEIFRRLMVLQRRRAQHTQLLSHELETGGSDPLLPDFWEDELSTIQAEERRLATLLEAPSNLTRQRGAMNPHDDSLYRDSPKEDEEEEMWALEAAQAEQAERDTEEEELAKRVEEAYGVEVTTPRKQTSNQAMDLDLDIDWEVMDAMDETDGMDIED